MKSKSLKRKNRKHSNQLFEYLKEVSMYDYFNGFIVKPKDRIQLLKDKIERQVNKYNKGKQ